MIKILQMEGNRMKTKRIFVLSIMIAIIIGAFLLPLYAKKPPKEPKDRIEVKTEKLQPLVDSGVITKAEMDTTILYFESNRIIIDKMKPKERRVYMDKQRKEGNDPLGLLIKNKVLTEEKAKAVNEAIHRKIHKPKPYKDKKPKPHKPHKPKKGR